MLVAYSLPGIEIDRLMSQLNAVARPIGHCSFPHGMWHEGAVVCGSLAVCSMSCAVSHGTSSFPQAEYALLCFRA